MSTDGGFPGQIGLTDYTSEINQHGFLIRQHLARLRTNVPVKIIAVHAVKGPQDQTQLPYKWTVDVTPIVNQVDGVGNPTQHGIVYGIPVFCLSGANGAVNVQPAIGDFGLMAVGDRDMSAAYANAVNGQNQGLGNPGSRRIHDLSDGVYLGGFGAINTAAQYIELSDKGTTVDTLGRTLTLTDGKGATIFMDGKGNMTQTAINITAQATDGNFDISAKVVNNKNGGNVTVESDIAHGGIIDLNF